VGALVECGREGDVEQIGKDSDRGFRIKRKLSQVLEREEALLDRQATISKCSELSSMAQYRVLRRDKSAASMGFDDRYIVVSARLALMMGLCRMEREEYREISFSDRLKMVFKITESAVYSIEEGDRPTFEEEKFDFSEVDELCLFSLSNEISDLLKQDGASVEESIVTSPLREFEPLSFMAIPDPFYDLISECLKKFRGGISPFSSNLMEGEGQDINPLQDKVLSGYSVLHSRTPLLVQFLREFWFSIESIEVMVLEEEEGGPQMKHLNIPVLKMLYEQMILFVLANVQWRISDRKSF